MKIKLEADHPVCQAGLCVLSDCKTFAIICQAQSDTWQRLTLSSRIVVGSSSNELLPAGTQGGETWQQFVQLQPLGSVLCQLLPDLLHLGRHRGRLPQPLDSPLQGLQQRVHLVVKLGTEGRK